MKYFLLTLFSALFLSSCSEGTPSQILDQAEQAVAEGDFQEARLCCHSLSDTSRYHLTPSQLCRQAIIYAHISEWDDDPDDMAAATRCYNEAISISADSVIAFASTLNLEGLATLNMIHSVGQVINNPTEMMEDVYEDQEESTDPLPHKPETL